MSVSRKAKLSAQCNRESSVYDFEKSTSNDLKVGDFVEVLYIISGKDFEGKCWGKIVKIKGKTVDVQWFYEYQELGTVVDEDCAPLAKRFSKLSPMKGELYFSKDINTMNSSKIAAKVPSINCLCRQCASRVAVKKAKLQISHKLWYSFIFDRMNCSITEGTCHACGKLSMDTGCTNSSRTPTAERSLILPAKKFKSATERKAKNGLKFLETGVSLVQTSPKTIPSGGSAPVSRKMSLSQVGEMFSRDCDLTPTKTQNKTEQVSRKPLPRKLKLDGDGDEAEDEHSRNDDMDFDVEAADASEHSDQDDAYEFLASDTENPPSSRSDSDDDDFVSLPKQKSTSSRLPLKRSSGAQTPKKVVQSTGKVPKVKSNPVFEKANSTTKKTAAKPKISARKDFSISLPKRSVPKLKSTQSPYQLAQHKLHLSAVPESLPCREEEFLQIFNFVEKKLKSRTGGCLYVSGVPGTGKTATVQEVVSALHSSRQEGLVREFKFIDINGMRLTAPAQAFSSIWQQLKGERVSPDKAATLLDKYFQGGRAASTPIVLLADELDLLWTRKQRVLYSLFDWPSRAKAGLVVVAIANTMDLPERIMMNRVTSRLGLTRLTFQPYTFKQLEEIVRSRLEGLKIFEPDALQLAARKVAAVSGDARRALNICRRATEVAESRTEGPVKKGRKSGGRGLEKGRLVGIRDVDQAVTEMFSSPYIMAIRCASWLEQTFLKAVVAEFRALGVEEATFEQVHQQLMALCRIEGVQPPTVTAVSDVCCALYWSRLILVETGRTDLQQKIRLNVGMDDVTFALQQIGSV